jgi:hypothetical protein
VPAMLKRMTGRLAQALRKAGFLGRNPDQLWPGSRKV